MKIKKHHIIIFSFLFTIFFSFSLIPKFFNNTEEDLKQLLINEDCIKQALFTSKNNIIQTIIQLIKNEKKSIKTSIFLITNHQIANALIEAKSRNIDIEIITCQSNLNSLIHQLIDKFIKVYIFGRPVSKKHKGLMHNKFIIFEKNLNDKTVLLTGSFNLTSNAQKKNKENVVILEDKYLVKKYYEEFENIRSESRLISKAEPHNYDEQKREISIVEKFRNIFNF